MTSIDSLQPDPAPGFPLRVGVVDMGSNAIRLLAAEFIAPATYTELASERIPVRLGHQVYRTRRLDEAGIAAAVQAMKRFADILDQLDIVHYRAIATSAVRESRNGIDLVKQVREETGIRLEPISGAEEARLVYWAARDRIQIGDEPWVMADLGGGSLEIALVDGGGILSSETHTIGAVRLLEELGDGRKVGPFRQLVDEYLTGLRIIGFDRPRAVAGLFATGGNMEDLAGLSQAEPDARGVRVVSLKSMDQLVDRLAAMTVEERIEQLGLREDRADVILPAALVYTRVARLVGVQEIHAPRVGVKEGLLLDMVDGLTEKTGHAARHAKEVFSGSVALGRRFSFDESHGVHVARLAENLFDELTPIHELNSDDRDILLAAAVLHDIGQRIGYKKHHKHSYYLISQSELPGFPKEKVELVANVARYHRKAEPDPSHVAFSALEEDDQERVTRLAAMLRLADALDREHSQKVRNVRVSPSADGVSLVLEGEGDMSLERWAVERKSALFEKVFRREVRINE